MPGLMLPTIPARLTAELQRPALPLDPAVRASAAIGLITVGIIHVLEIQGQLSGAAWLTSGFVLTRSVAVPGDPGDRGNWLEPLGVAALFTEVIVTVLAVVVLASIWAPDRDRANAPSVAHR